MYPFNRLLIFDLCTANVDLCRAHVNWCRAQMDVCPALTCDSRWHFWMFSLAERPAAGQRDQQPHVHLLRLLHHLRLFLHTKPIHWCHHWQLQQTEEKGNFFLRERRRVIHIFVVVIKCVSLKLKDNNFFCWIPLKILCFMNCDTGIELYT